MRLRLSKHQNGRQSLRSLPKKTLKIKLEFSLRISFSALRISVHLNTEVRKNGPRPTRRRRRQRSGRGQVDNSLASVNREGGNGNKIR